MLAAALARTLALALALALAQAKPTHMAQEWTLPVSLAEQVPKFLSSRMPERWAADVLLEGTAGGTAGGDTSPHYMSDETLEKTVTELTAVTAKEQVSSSSRAIVVGPS